MSALAVLLRLLEQLPLPAAVRTVGAEIIGSNQLWRDRPPPPHWQFNYTPLSGAWSGLELIIAQEPSAEHLKNQFLACIDHELKSPLTSVIGIANLLNQRTLGELNQKQSRYVEIIRQSGKHLMERINNIIDLAQAEAGQLALEIETIDLKSVCQASMRQAIRWVEQTAWLNRQPSPHIHIELDLPADVPTCNADPARLQQMLSHLLINACKFSCLGESPSAYIAIKLQGRLWVRWLALTVIDHGIGIAEAEQHLIFQKFQQVDSSLTRRYQGVGVGLVLTRQLARLHGGDVTFLSQVGVGSEFTILLPHDSTSKSNNLVLIGETQTLAINHLINLLRSAGYQGVVARNGIEALEKIRLLRPLAGIVSADLPLLSGWDILHTVRQTQPSYVHRIAVAIRPGESDHGLPDAVLAKPITLESLNLFLGRMHRIPLLLYISKSLDKSSVLTLQGLGYRLLEAEDRQQAEVLCRIWQPDLLIARHSEELPTASLPWVLVDPADPQEALAKAVNEALTQGISWETDPPPP